MKIKAHYYTIMKRQRCGLLSEKWEGELHRFLLARHCLKRNFFVVFIQYGPVTKPNLFFFFGNPHVTPGVQGGVGEKKNRCEVWSLGNQDTPVSCPSPAQALIVTLGSVPGSGTWIPPLLSYPAQEEGWRGGELGPAPRDCGCPGCTTLHVLAAPRPWKAVRPIFPQAPPPACLGTSLFPGSPGRVPADWPGAPHWCLRCREATPRLSFPSPRSLPSTVHSHPGPSSFGEPLTSLPPRDSHLGSVSRPSPSFRRPLLPSGDLPFTLSLPPGDPQFTHAHPSSDSHVFPPACLLPRSLSSSRGAGG